MDNTWIGDWVHDKTKLNNLTEQRAVDDIWAMHESPDYTDSEMKQAMRVAAKQLGLKREEFIAVLQFRHDGNKVS